MKRKTESKTPPPGISNETAKTVSEAADYRAQRRTQKREVLAKREVENKPQGNDEYEQVIAEDANLDTDGLIAEEAFLIASQRHFEAGDTMADWLQAEAKVDGFAIGSVTEQRNEARNDRRNHSGKDRRISAR